MTSSRRIAATIAGALACLPAAAPAAGDPKFDYGKPEEVKTVEWKAAGRAGLVSTTGNSQTFTTTVGATATRKYSENKLGIDANLAYGRSRSLSVVDGNGDMVVDETEIARVGKTTTNAWGLQGRYDRFFTANNSAYGSAQIARDRPAGKELVAGGQVGYSRQLVKTDRNALLLEAGYDFSYERYVAVGSEAVPIHSGRVFLGETLTLSKATAATANLEVLTNLATEKAPAPGYEAPTAGKDTRVVGKVGLTTTLWSRLSFGFSFGLRLDQAPAPLAGPPQPASPPAGTPPTTWAPGFYPTVDKLDTITEANLIVTLM